MSYSIASHLLQSTVFASVAGILVFFLRNNHAGARYWIWLVASMKFLIPFSLFVEIGHRLSWSTVPATVQPRLVVVMDQISQPFAAPIDYVTTRSAPASIMPALLLAIWIGGCAAILMFWFLRWSRVAVALRTATRLREGREWDSLRRIESMAGIERQTELLTSTAPLEPGIFGILRQKLWLPAGIGVHLEDAHLDAILAHELCHLRRRDNLTAALHMLVEAVFWFHPLVWWIGARLVEERERACDEEVLRLGADPEAYAEGILNVCKLYLESPLVCVSGVTGADLKKRIEAIMTNRAVLRLNFGKKVALVTAGAVALAMPVVVGIVHAPSIRAQSAAAPKFEVASIRLGCPGGESAPAKMEAGKQVKAGRGPVTTVGRLNECHTLADFIHMAYVMYAGGQFHWVWGPQFEAGPPLEGGPAWVRSDSYQIIAKPAGTASREAMSGPMLQTLLEDRFKLKIHRESKDVPVYALTVGKGGLKLTPSKVGCFLTPPRQPGDPMTPIPAGQKPCMDMIGFRKGPNTGLNAQDASLDKFCILLSKLVDRPVVDKTGIAGKFDIHLEFAVDESTPRFLPGGDMAGMLVQPSSDPAGPSVFTAVEQLGLKLEPTKGPGDFLVIDGVQRPSAN